MNRPTKLTLSALLLTLTGGGIAGFMQPALQSAGPLRGAVVTGTGSSDYKFSIGNRISTATFNTYGLPIFELSPGDPSSRFARAEFSFASSTAATTIPFRVWVGKKSNAATPDYEFQLLGTGTFTSRASGAGTSASAIITSSEYVADTITFVPATLATSPIGIYDSLNATYGTTYTLYSPGSLVPAHLFISDFANFRYVVFEFDPANGPTAVVIADPGT